MFGLINLIHSDPLYFALSKKTEVIRDSPENILNMIKDDKIDAGMVSLIPFLNSGLKLSETANIHSVKNTVSTLLISNKKHIENKIKISVTSLTATTSFYLSTILNKMKINYKFVKSKYHDAKSLLEENDYSLVIGDDALDVYSKKYNIIFDIGYEFSHMFNLMPVYAVTATKKYYDNKIINDAINNSKNYIEKSIEKNQNRIKRNILDFYYNDIKYDFNNEVNETIKFIQKIKNKS